MYKVIVYFAFGTNYIILIFVSISFPLPPPPLVVLILQPLLIASCFVCLKLIFLVVFHCQPVVVLPIPITTLFVVSLNYADCCFWLPLLLFNSCCQIFCVPTLVPCLSHHKCCHCTLNICCFISFTPLLLSILLLTVACNFCHTCWCCFYHCC